MLPIRASSGGPFFGAYALSLRCPTSRWSTGEAWTKQRPRVSMRALPKDCHHPKMKAMRLDECGCTCVPLWSKQREFRGTGPRQIEVAWQPLLLPRAVVFRGADTNNEWFFNMGSFNKLGTKAIMSWPVKSAHSLEGHLFFPSLSICARDVRGIAILSAESVDRQGIGWKGPLWMEEEGEKKQHNDPKKHMKKTNMN
eukprot:247450-Amphidinium_carterae.2